MLSLVLMGKKLEIVDWENINLSAGASISEQFINREAGNHQVRLLS